MMPNQQRDQSPKKEKRNFSSFTLKEAMQLLGIERLRPWLLEATPRSPSEFFLEYMRRVQQLFDTTSTERAKELLVDAYCVESLQIDYALKLWKSAPVTSDDLTGVVDYLLTPLLCVIEAKKDDFEHGLAQALVEMYACQQINEAEGIRHPLYAIVTNGDTWRFYRYEAGQIYATEPYVRTGHATLLGVLDVVFALCWQHRQASVK